MRILFIGTVEFSASALHELITMKANLVGVCTASASTFNSDHVDLTPIAEQAGIPVFDTSDINSTDTLNWIRGLAPDILFCFGWSQLIKKPLLSLPPKGVIGFHPAALPANRGRHPLVWALVLGLRETASTFFFMDKGPDSGDILSQVRVLIDKSDDARSLYDRITKVAMEQIRNIVPCLARGSITRLAQDPQKANVWRKRGFVDGQIDWRMAASSIHNLVRGLARPYVGAHFDFDGQSVKVWKTEIDMNVPDNFEPGKVLEILDAGVLVKAGVGAVRLLEFDSNIQFKVGDYL